jgi:hypothetical protein
VTKSDVAEKMLDDLFTQEQSIFQVWNFLEKNKNPPVSGTVSETLLLQISEKLGIRVELKSERAGCVAIIEGTPRTVGFGATEELARQNTVTEVVKSRLIEKAFVQLKGYPNVVKAVVQPVVVESKQEEEQPLEDAIWTGMDSLSL